MLSSQSVKKPYTVVVAVVLVIILGIVSFTHMTTDLLPEMTLPYAVVYTTYGGASPEEVETAVTKPVEQAMATISNIEQVQSVSSENVSMVVLEFAQSTNMDSATIEMRESLDQISAYWSDEVGSPVIMKLNPDMMPVMVAAVEAGDMSRAELTDFVDDKITPDLESIEGVASVNTSGDVEEKVEVVLRQEKIDALNKKIQDALDGKFADAENEMKEQESELAKGKQALEDGQQQLADATSQAEGQISQGQSEILKNEMQLDSKLAEVDAQLAQIETQEKTLASQEKELDDAKKQLDALPGQLTQAKAGLQQMEESIKALDQLPSRVEQIYLGADASDGKNAAEEAKAAADALEAAVTAATLPDEQVAQMTEEEKAAYTQNLSQLQSQLAAAKTVQTQAESGLTALKTTLSGMGISADADVEIIKQEINNKKTELIAQKVSLEQNISTLQKTIDDSASKQKEIKAGKQKIADAKKQMASGKEQLQSAKTQMESAKAQIASGKASVASALAQLNAQKISATIEIASNKAKIDMGETQMESAKTQLADQKDSAYENADADKIITAETVRNILKAQNFSMPAGYVTEDGIDYLVRVGDKFSDTEDMENLVLMDMHIDGVNPVKLSDVADVVVTDNSSEVYAKINGNAGIMFTMQKQSGYSTGEVSDRIKAKFAQLEEEFEDFHVVTLMDQGIYIDMVVDSVINNMLSGAVLAILVLLLFLKSIRPTIVIAFSIPISIMTAIVLMYFSGVTLNIISLSGLALGIGMLVDNSIVVIENIYRMRSIGVPPRKAAIEGAKQVSGAIAASTLTTVCVFAPIVFTEGITRQLFVDMGLTIAYSLLASLVVALTLVPMMGAGLLKKTPAKPSRWFEKIQNGYAALLDKLLYKKWLVILVSAVLLVLSAILSVSRGTAFMADMDSTQMTATLTAPEGSTLEDTAELTDTLVEKIRAVDGVTDVGAMAGSGSMSMMGMGDGTSSTQTSIYILLDENKKQTNEEIAKEIKDQSADMDCDVSVSASTMDMSALGGSGISVEIEGRDLDKLQQAAGEVAELVKQVPGTVDVSDGIDEKTTEMRLRVKKKKAMKYNLTTAQVYQFLQGKLSEAGSSTTLSTDEKDYNVVVKDDRDESLTRELIRKLKITGTDADGKEVEVPLKELVEFKDAEGFSSINRKDQKRYVTVTASLDDGYNIGLVSSDVQKKLDTYQAPAGCELHMTGEDETINEAMQQVGLMLVLALVFMYLIMVAQFQSLLSPFIVMFTVPLAFTGGFLGLYLTGNPVSVIAMIGFVMLCGIIVNNGIVLVDYTNQLRLEGMEKHEALVEAGRTRLRPVIMTAMTTVFGLFGMAFGVGMGADMVQPMAIVVIGGLTYGTLLTLFVVPCIYDAINRRKMKKFEDEE